MYATPNFMEPEAPANRSEWQDWLTFSAVVGSSCPACWVCSAYFHCRSLPDLSLCPCLDHDPCPSAFPGYHAQSEWFDVLGLGMGSNSYCDFWKKDRPMFCIILLYAAFQQNQNKNMSVLHNVKGQKTHNENQLTAHFFKHQKFSFWKKPLWMRS